MTDLPNYEVYALRYGTHRNRTARDNFIFTDAHDLPMPLDYFIWAVRHGDETIVVDTGFNRQAGEARGRLFLRDPGEALQQLGIDPRQVADVIITHLHYDHAGNLDVFPNANFHVQDREMGFATGRHMCHVCLRNAFDVEDVVAMVRRVYTDRVRFHDGAATIRPGLSVHRVGGHSDGLQIVRVHTARGWLVLASDASHYYANFERRSPFPIVFNVGEMLEGYQLLEQLSDGPDHIIPGHDPEVLTTYPAVVDGEIVRVDATPLQPRSPPRS